MKLPTAKIDQERRSFLKQLSVALFATPALDIIVESIIDGSLNTAVAQSNQTSRYLMLQMPQAPARWMFDLPLNPLGETIAPNAGVGTCFGKTGNIYTRLRYATTNHAGLRVPIIWKNDVPHSNGQSRRMRDLLDNMFILRGIDVKNNGHTASNKLNFQPPGASTSITALTSDNSSAPVDAIEMNSVDYVLKSRKGSTVASVGNDVNVIKQLVDVFQVDSGNSLQSKKAQLSQELKKAYEALGKESTSHNSQADQVVDNLQKAREIFKNGFGNVDTLWGESYTKYKSLVERSFAHDMPDFNDAVVKQATVTNLSQVRGDRYNNDLRNLANASQLLDMAKVFTFAEFVWKEKLTNSLVCRIKPYTQIAGKAGTFDDHETGGMATLMLNSMAFRAMSACLLEFIDAIGEEEFNNTVIHLSGEFNRSPRSDGSGSDHAGNAQSTTLISGKFPKLQIVGDIIRDSGSQGYSGTYGVGADAHPIGLIAATLATALGTPSPVRGIASALKVEDGKLIATMPTGKLIT